MVVAGLAVVVASLSIQPSTMAGDRACGNEKYQCKWLHRHEFECCWLHVLALTLFDFHLH